MSAFIDTNVVVHALGREHPTRDNAREILRASLTDPGVLVTDSEVIQELIHVYLRREGIERARRAVTAFRQALHDRIVEATLSDILAALATDFPPQLQSRDRIHIAVMQRLGITDIISADQAFDMVPGIRRLDPLRLEEWREEVFGAG